MGKRNRGANRRGRSEGEPRFIQIPYWVMETPAFLALSPNGTRALLFLVKRFNGVNNGKICFGVRSGCFVKPPGQADLVDRPILAKGQVQRALAELQAAGFIRCTKEATFNQKKLTREWRITWLPCDGKPATKEFAGQNLKPSPMGGPIDPNTVPLVDLSPTQNGVVVPLQSHRRAYDRVSQAHQWDTSSNHPLGTTQGGRINA